MSTKTLPEDAAAERRARLFYVAYGPARSLELVRAFLMAINPSKCPALARMRRWAKERNWAEEANRFDSTAVLAVHINEFRKAAAED